ncbi:hypothetical protein [Evtepia sp.]|nr:hypothetical protein [Candidatus Evtepia faecavium]
MTIHTTGGGVVLTLAREELPRKAPLTGEALLPLVCRALGRVGRPLPPAGEIAVFPGPAGVLVTVTPRLAETEGWAGPPQ